MADRASVVFVTEPLLTPEFVQYRVQAPLLDRLRRTFDITVASPAVGVEVRSRLEAQGIDVVSANARFPEVRHPHDEVPSYILSWARDAFLHLNHRALAERVARMGALRVNLSMTSAVPAEVWYLQGRPLDASLAALAPSFPPLLRTAALLGRAPTGLLDRRHFDWTVGMSSRIYTNSRFNALWFRGQGVRVQGVLSQFYSSSKFSPTTSHPTRDYALVYLGKETDTAAVRQLMELNHPIRMFGAKSAGWVEGSLRGRTSAQVEFLGRVSEDELAELYTNALFTAFPFTEEPFGLVPVESMACGTPVLTYRWQGPAETVLDGKTGWLSASRSQFIVRANELFEKGVPSSFSSNCAARARLFHVDHMAEVWTALLRARLSGGEDPESCRDALGAIEVQRQHGYPGEPGPVGSAPAVTPP